MSGGGLGKKRLKGCWGTTFVVGGGFLVNSGNGHHRKGKKFTKI